MFTDDAQTSTAVATPSSSSSSAEQLVVVTLTSGGTVRTGGELALPVFVTVTICVHEATPSALVAVQVMIV
jgi:hypothetical protein